MVNGMLGLILCNGIVHIVSSSLQINIFWMRMQRAWKWIVWQEWPHTLALLPIWYKEQWKEYYSHVKLATPFLLFCEFFSILPYIYIYLFLLLFSALHHCCFVKLSHNFLTCPKVNPAGSIQLLFPPPFPFVRPLKQQAQLRIPQSYSTFKQSSAGPEAAPTALNQPARGKVSLRENAGQQQPGPCDDREKATGGSAGCRLVYAAH